MSRKVVQTFCIDIEELEKLEVLCEKRRLSKSELVRQGLRLVFAEHDHNQPDPISARVSMDPNQRRHYRVSATQPAKAQETKK